ncbi:MAG TPA: acylphosphatase [Chitinophagaceae bacterium]
METVRIRVEGRVQGVFFRQSTVERAQQLGLDGTVRNCEDGSVEIIATGHHDAIEELIRWCWHGPPKSKVTAVSSEQLSLQQFNNFSILRN